MKQELEERLDGLLSGSNSHAMSATEITAHYWPHYLAYADVTMLQGVVESFPSRDPALYNMRSEIAPGVFADPAIVTAPMDTVTGAEMAIFCGRFSQLHKKGGIIPVIHRNFFPRLGEGYGPVDRVKIGIERSVAEYKRAAAADIPIFMAVGINQNFVHVDALVDAGCVCLCVDVAKGWDFVPINFVRELHLRHPNVKIMAGNVANPQAVADLAAAGVHTVRVGIGGGGVCITGEKTGFYSPMFSTVALCAAKARQIADTCIDQYGWPIKVIADGGIRHPGDIIKAWAAGAHAVMIGSMFAGYDECPGKAIQISGRSGLWMEHRGMASEPVGIGDPDSVEGAVTYIQHRGKLEIVMRGILRDIASGMSYAGVLSIDDLLKNARFARMSSAGMAERAPSAAMHGVSLASE